MLQVTTVSFERRYWDLTTRRSSSCSSLVRLPNSFLLHPMTPAWNPARADINDTEAVVGHKEESVELVRRALHHAC